MTFDEAKAQLAAFFQAHGADSPGLNARGLGGVVLGQEQLAFEYVGARGTLRCAALIYRFRGMPKQAVLEAFRAEAKDGAPTGGGAVDYDPVARAVFLTRVYDAPVDDAQFVADLSALMEACGEWREHRVAKISARAFRDDLR